MELNYVLTLEDYVAFSVDQSRTIPSYRRQGLIYRLSGFLIFAVFGAWKAVKTPGGSILSLVVFAVLAFAWVGLYGRYAKWSMRRQYRAYFRNPEHTQRLGLRHMKLNEKEMILEMEGGEPETIDLSGITRLTSDKGHYFLYFGDLAGMPVPYSAFATKDEGWEFLRLIRAGAPALGSQEE